MILKRKSQEQKKKYIQTVFNKLKDLLNTGYLIRNKWDESIEDVQLIGWNKEFGLTCITEGARVVHWAETDDIETEDHQITLAELKTKFSLLTVSEKPVKIIWKPLIIK